MDNAKISHYLQPPISMVISEAILGCESSLFSFSFETLLFLVYA